jgi:hypothetical protein
VGEELVDPDGAEYQFGPDQTNTSRYCSIVNTKNHMGGYTGYAPFKVEVVRDGRGHITETSGGLIMDGESSESLKLLFQKINLDYCHEHGFKISY